MRTSDLVVELNLPNMSGLRVLAALNRGADQCSIPTLVMARRLDKDDLQRAVGLGARHCMAKPFSGADILTGLTQLPSKAANVPARQVVRV
jgi:DNA-binding response OmpR family regulator